MNPNKISYAIQVTKESIMAWAGLMKEYLICEE